MLLKERHIYIVVALKDDNVNLASEKLTSFIGE